MGLMLPPGPMTTTPVEHYMRRRSFRVHTCCTHCQKEKVQHLVMIDEIGGSADEVDFYASGAVGQLDRQCSCGSDSLTIINASYLRQATDV